MIWPAACVIAGWYPPVNRIIIIPMGSTATDRTESCTVAKKTSQDVHLQPTCLHSAQGRHTSTYHLETAHCEHSDHCPDISRPFVFVQRDLLTFACLGQCEDEKSNPSGAQTAPTVSINKCHLKQQAKPGIESFSQMAHVRQIKALARTNPAPHRLRPLPQTPSSQHLLAGLNPPDGLMTCFT